jgi:hypothetical protein
MSELTIILAALGFAINLLVLAIGGTWKLSRVEASINKTISEHKLEIEQSIITSERRMGETIAAIRTKIHEVETWARDEFVRKGSFGLVATEIKASVTDLGKEIKTRLERMEGKIDDASKS